MPPTVISVFRLEMTSKTKLPLHMKNDEKIAVGFLCLIRSCIYATISNGTINMVPDCSRLGPWKLLPQSLWVVVVTIEALPGREHAISARGLKSFALMVWRKITLTYLRSPMETMQKRKKAVVDAQKSHRKYRKHRELYFVWFIRKLYHYHILSIYFCSS